MSRYFTRTLNGEYIRSIRHYMEAYGSVNCQDSKLEELWRDFSDERYDVQFLIPTVEVILEFIDYLEDLED